MPLTNVSVSEIVLLLLTAITDETPAILYVMYQMWDFFHCSVVISLISSVYYKISRTDQHCVPVYLNILKEIKKYIEGKKKSCYFISEVARLQGEVVNSPWVGTNIPSLVTCVKVAVWSRLFSGPISSGHLHF